MDEKNTLNKDMYNLSAFLSWLLGKCVNVPAASPRTGRVSGNWRLRIRTSPMAV
jgi:hypothetical protein